MKRRIILIVFCIVATVATLYFALWYSGYFEVRACVQRGGEWVRVRNMCVDR